jgi:chemotaxis signal transduction protein
MVADVDTQLDFPKRGDFEALRVRISGEDYLIPIALTEHIVDWQNSSRVPRTDPGVHGVTDIRGEIVVILNVAPYLASASVSELDSDCAILVLDPDIDDQRVAIVVDSVVDTVEEGAESVIDAAELGDVSSPGIESGVIAGVLSESVAEDSDGVPDELASGDFHGDLPDDLTGILNPKALIDIAGTQSTD